MAINNWASFKRLFKKYISSTVGIFTLITETDFTYFDLDRFLEMRASTTNITMTQIEMLMALSTFIEIQEFINAVNFDIIPGPTKRQLKVLIEKDHLRLHPFSKLKRQCLEYLAISPEAAIASVCASAA